MCGGALVRRFEGILTMRLLHGQGSSCEGGPPSRCTLRLQTQIYTTSHHADTSNAFARLSMTSAVGFAFPRSIPLIVRTHRSEIWAKSSCVQPNCVRRILTFMPIVLDNITRPFLRAAILSFRTLARISNAIYVEFTNIFWMFCDWIRSPQAACRLFRFWDTGSAAYQC